MNAMQMRYKCSKMNLKIHIMGIFLIIKDDKGIKLVYSFVDTNLIIPYVH